MSRSRHRQHAGARQWNPPPIKPQADTLEADPQAVQSATECTGLMARPAATQEESSSLAALYAVHPFKPQGNIGKGNPNNDPSEIRFHRS